MAEGLPGRRSPSGKPSDATLHLVASSSFLDSFSESVILAEVDGSVRTMNRAALELLGYTEAEVQGRPLSEFVAHADFVRGKGLSHLLQPAVDHEWEIAFRTSSGGEIPMAIHVSALRTPTGATDAVVILGSDLRPARQLDELRVLHSVASAGTEATDEDALIEKVTQVIGEAFYPDNFGVLLYDEKEDVLRAHPSYRGTTEEALHMVFHLGEGVAGTVAQTGKAWRLPDVRQESKYLAVHPGSMSSELCVPLKIGDRVIGVVNAESAKLDFFSQEDERLLGTVASQLATAIERVRLFEVQRRQRQLAEALRDVGASLSAVLDFDVVLDQVLEQIERVVPYDAASVMLVDDEHARVVRMRGYERYGEETARAFADLVFNISATPNLRRMIDDRGPIVIADTASDPDWVQLRFAPSFRSWAGAPIVVQGKVLGFFSLDKVEPGFYAKEHADRLSAFAGQAALALQNARLFEESVRQTQELAGLYQAALATASVLETDVLLRRLYDQVKKLLSADSFGVVLYHEESDELEIALALDEGEDVDIRSRRMPTSEGGLTGWVLRTRQPLLISDLEEGPLPVPPVHFTKPVRSWLGVPLMARDRLLGAVTVQSFRPHAFREADRRFLEAVSGQAAVSLENAHLFEMTQRRAAEAETLRKSSAVVASALRQDDAIRLILEQLAVVVPYDSASVQLLGDGYLEIVGGRGWPDASSVEGTRFPIPGENPNTVVIQTQRPYILGEAAQVYSAFRGPPHDHIRSWLGVPLFVQDRIIGMLAIDSSRPDYFNQDHARHVAAFADHVAIALENARLFEATRRQANEMGTLVEVTSALRAAATMEEMLPLILQKATGAVGGASGAVYLLDAETGELVARGFYPPRPEAIGARLRPGKGVAGHVAASGEIYVMEDVPHETRLQFATSELDPSRDTASSISLPLRAQDQAIGVLHITMAQRHAFAPEEVRLLTAVAEIAGNALHRAAVLQTLEERVLSRTRELEEANERLRELDRLKSDFVSNVSHELRTPITNILLYLDLMGQIGKEHKRESYLRVLQRESARLARLIEDLLTLSRIEQDRQPLNIESHNLNSLVSEVVSAYEARARAKGIRLVHESDPELPQVLMDWEQMVQVFANLIGNGLAYTPQGGTVRLNSELKNASSSPSVAVHVFNNGPPIPEADFPHLFERFYRGKTGRDSGEPGTGLGLAICKEIMGRHSGWIEVESGEEGTVFTVGLPLAP